MHSVTRFKFKATADHAPLEIIWYDGGIKPPYPDELEPGRQFGSNDGTMYVNIGSPSNSCQESDRKPNVPGVDPCTELDTRAGIWKFDARKKNQTQSASNHFAKGIRNAVGISISPLDGKLWTTQHGQRSGT